MELNKYTLEELLDTALNSKEIVVNYWDETKSEATFIFQEESYWIILKKLESSIEISKFCRGTPSGYYPNNDKFADLVENCIQKQLEINDLKKELAEK